MDSSLSPRRRILATALVCAATWCIIVVATNGMAPNYELWSHTAQLVISAALVVVTGMSVLKRGGRLSAVLFAAVGVWLIGDIVLMSTMLWEPDLGVSYDAIFLVGQSLWLIVGFVALDHGPRGTAMIRSSDGAMFAMVFVFAVFTVTRGWGTISAEPSLLGIAVVADGSAAALFYLAAVGVKAPYRVPYAILAIAAALLLVSNTMYFRGILTYAAEHIWLLEIGWTVAQLLRLGAVMMLVRALDEPPRTAQQDPRPFRMLLPIALVVTGLAAVSEPFSEWGALRKYLLVAMAVTLVIREFVTWRVIRRYEAADQRARRELRRRADNDDLTGLLRRDRIFDRLRKSVVQARDEGAPVAVAYVDLNDFSSINDNFGHGVGDRALMEVAARLNATRAELVGRIGGDEFLLGGFPSWDAYHPDHLRQSIADALDSPLNVGGGVALRVTASVGVAVAQPDQPITLEELVVRADHASYHEKRGFGQVSSDSARSLLSVTPLDEVRRPLQAMADDRIVVWYQPVIDLSTDSVAGAEALARIVEDDGSVKQAASFVPILQAAGYGEDLTHLVLNRATNDFAHGAAFERGWFVNVNVAEGDLAAGGICDHVGDAVRRSGLKAERLTLEIDERIDPTGPLIGVVEELRRLGVRVALDDFGAGSSAFGQISQVSPALLKLDIGLLPTVGESDTGMQSAALIEAFIRLAHHLGIQVIAEGVETEEQRDLLKSLGCEYGQGFLWSPAQALDELVEWDIAHRTCAERSVTSQ